MSTVSETQTFELRETIWAKVSRQLSDSERGAVRFALGVERVQANEDLVMEAKSLLSVWADLRKTVDADVSASMPAVQRLPEPPNQRERLVSQIRFHVENFKQLAKEKGVVLEEIMPVETPRDRAILGYVTQKPVTQRPASAPARGGILSLVDTRHCASARTTQSTGQGAMTAVASTPRGPHGSLLISSDHKYVEELRRALDEEHKSLVEDIAFLRKCIEDEATYRRQAVKAAKAMGDEPNLGEMREFNAKLEKSWLEGVGNRRRELLEIESHFPSFSASLDNLKTAQTTAGSSTSPAGQRLAPVVLEAVEKKTPAGTSAPRKSSRGSSDTTKKPQ